MLRLCSYLEYQLSRTFAHSADKEIKWFWCDGIAMPFVKSYLTKENLNNAKELITEAWIGPDGQGKYEMLIKFGSVSLKNILEDNSLMDCIPDTETMDWVTVDACNQKIEVRLK